MLSYKTPEQKQTSTGFTQKRLANKALVSPNITGIPDSMKTRFENLSAFSFDDMRIHYNSNKPAQLQALAYTKDNDDKLEKQADLMASEMNAAAFEQQLDSTSPPVQMAWDPVKAPLGPTNFTNADAENAVTNADFASSVFVNISGRSENTKQAYTFVTLGSALENRTICVVGHTHRNPTTGTYNVPGSSFIPGWDSWTMQTPQAQATVISGLPVGGDFPANRYPY